MGSNLPISEVQEREISIKDLIHKFQEWIKFLWKKKLIIILFAFLGAALGFTYALLKKTQYKAELTFILEDNKSNQLASYAGIAGQFGIDLGGNTGSGVFSGDNIMGFLQSRLMVERTLLTPFSVANKTQSLADFYINVYELRKGWQKFPAVRNITFPANGDRRNFSLQQDSILKIIYTELINTNLKITKPDKKLSFISVECESPDELFSKVFTEHLVKEAIDFYVQTKTQRSKTTVDKLQLKADSIETQLNSKTYSVAASQDFNLNPARNMATVGTEMVMRDKVVLQTMYAEVIKNLELSRMTMAQETPIIQIVDTPILPLEKVRLGYLKGLIVGGFLFGFLTAIWLTAANVYRKIMS